MAADALPQRPKKNEKASERTVANYELEHTNLPQPSMAGTLMFNETECDGSGSSYQISSGCLI